MQSPKKMFDELPWVLFEISPRMSELRAFYNEGEITPALYDALVLVRDSGCPTPEWVWDGAIRIVADRLKVGFSISKGPKGNELGRYRKDMEHFRRWQTVRRLRNQGIKAGDVFNEASIRLQGKWGSGSDETIRKSFYRVQKDLKDEKKRLRYYLGMRVTCSP